MAADHRWPCNQDGRLTAPTQGQNGAEVRCTARANPPGTADPFPMRACSNVGTGNPAGDRGAERMAIKIHEHFISVQRQDREMPVLGFCTSKLTARARQLIEEHLSRPDLPVLKSGAVWRFDLNQRTGALRAQGFLVASA